MALRQVFGWNSLFSSPSVNSKASGIAKFSTKSKCPYIGSSLYNDFQFLTHESYFTKIKVLLDISMKIAVKVGIPEFLNGVGKGLETHMEKLETEIGDFQKLLFTRTIKLKRLGIPCQHAWTVEASSCACKILKSHLVRLL